MSRYDDYFFMDDETPFPSDGVLYYGAHDASDFLEVEGAGLQVNSWHRAFGVPQDRPLDHTAEDLLELRLNLIREEFEEVVKALADVTNSQYTDASKTALLKELCDLCVVAIGTADTFGMDFDGAFREVMRSNMSKLGPSGEVLRRDDGKVLKGPNYRAPDLSAFI